MNTGKKDIENREDLIVLLDDFYKLAINDSLIGHFFTKVVKLDLSHHIPIIADFWETVLFGTGRYTKNAIEPHIEINKRSPIEDRHFQRWLELFNQTIDKHFSGPTAEMARQRALSIATVMRIKLSKTARVNIKRHDD